MVRRVIEKAIAHVRKANRRNRVWFVVVRGEEAILVKPDFYKDSSDWNLHEADQLRWGEKPHKAAHRLGGLILKGLTAEFGYLKRYQMKGGSPYKDLYVMYALCSGDVELPVELDEYTVLLKATAQRGSHTKLATQVQDDLMHMLADHSGIISSQVLRRLRREPA